MEILSIEDTENLTIDLDATETGLIVVTGDTLSQKVIYGLTKLNQSAFLDSSANSSLMCCIETSSLFSSACFSASW